MAVAEATKHDNIVDALAAAQGEFGEIIKNCTAEIATKNGAKYSYKYADLGDVLSATRPVLSRHGLAVSWVYREGEKSGDGHVITQLLHHAGKLESEIPVFYDRSAQSVMQSLGSAITYAKRYGLCGLIGVVAEDDDDGQGAGPAPRPERQERKEASREPARAAHTQEPKKEAAKSKIELRIDASKDPDDLKKIIAWCRQQYAEVPGTLETIFNYIGEVNRQRVRDAFEFDACGELKLWDDDVRKEIADTITESVKSLVEASATPAAEAPTNDWHGQATVANKPEVMMALISECSRDPDAIADFEKYQDLCDHITLEIDKREAEWGEQDTKLVRQLLFSRMDLVHADHKLKEAANNG